jgi:hypothetical protein
MALIKISTKGTNLTCDELDNNFDFVLDLANAVGELDCAKINQLSLSTCLLLNQVIIDLQADIDDAETAIGEVAQDLIDVQTTLQGNINSLTTLINNQNTTIADLNTQVATLIAGFNSLSGTVASFDSRLLSLEGRVTTLEEAIASGLIVVWVGLIANIPAGWQLTDGTNGTPDLRNRFIIGAGSTYAVNAVGGSANHIHNITGTTNATALTVDQMPAHTHTVIDPGHIHAIPFSANADQGSGAFDFGGSPFNGGVTTVGALTGIVLASNGSNGAHSHGFSASTASTTNLPPYYALAYIMRM